MGGRTEFAAGAADRRSLRRGRNFVQDLERAAADRPQQIRAYFPDTSTVELVQARFTFAMRRAGDNWQIIRHHSSAFPAA
jgi:hypothetical protein